MAHEVTAKKLAAIVNGAWHIANDGNRGTTVVRDALSPVVAELVARAICEIPTDDLIRVLIQESEVKET